MNKQEFIKKNHGKAFKKTYSAGIGYKDIDKLQNDLVKQANILNLKIIKLDKYKDKIEIEYMQDNIIKYRTYLLDTRVQNEIGTVFFRSKDYIFESLQSKAYGLIKDINIINDTSFKINCLDNTYISYSLV